MKSDLLQDAIGLVKDEYIEDAHCPQSDVRVEKKNGKQNLVLWGRWAAGLCAAMLLVVGVWKSGVIRDLPVYLFWGNGETSESTEESAGETEKPEETEGPAIETPGMTEEVPTQTEDPIYDESIIWSGELTDSAEDMNFQWGVAVEPGVTLSEKFTKLLGQAEASDRFAFIVSDPMPYNWVGIGAFTEERQLAEEELLRVSRACREELMEKYGISSAEAGARKFSDPRFIEARSRLQDVYAEIDSASILARYKERHKMFDALADLGFTVLYTAEDEIYQPYLGAFGGLGVMVGTKEEILSLLDLEISYVLKLYPAAEDAAEYRPSTYEYTGKEISLAGDSKVTVELVEAYEKAAGAALNVVIHIGYIDVEEVPIKAELEAAAIAAMGLTADEFWALVDGPDGSEWMNRLIEEKNRIVYHKDYNEGVAERFLLEGELKEILHYAAEIEAVLTYERAMEIQQYKEIGYIELAED